jgi:nucleotide-binding universal stress UspA family protein
MKTILVPLDGSALAEQVLPHVTMLARLLNARVRLLHVLTESDREGVITGGGLPRRAAAGTVTFYFELERLAWATLREQADIYLTAQAVLLRAAEHVVDIDVRIGMPLTCIMEAAQSEPDTLIALATHGHGGLRRLALGSLADNLIRAAAVPVFVVRAASHTTVDSPLLRRIMVPLDGSDRARSALPQAAALARSAGAELIVLQAVVPTTHYAGLLLMRRNQATQALGGLAHDLRQQHQVVVTPAVAVDYTDVAQAIVTEAAQRNVDLIVMATHGYGGVRRWALGSVADTVLRTTTSPLLLMRAQKEPA